GSQVPLIVVVTPSKVFSVPLPPVPNHGGLVPMVNQVFITLMSLVNARCPGVGLSVVHAATRQSRPAVASLVPNTSPTAPTAFCDAAIEPESSTIQMKS